ncbi:MAG: class I SAM-dependent methyltransferase family protein [Methanocellales archaeon]|nr:class I SAM-dependent methyltransferase family protein [Methanocellales archaeon]MDD3420714.1 class I SAM-dependent methyltransferase family protein [Methanocellales archaeon]MDD4898073.1 class I SAM-dependent methyltransferase family protein [Methanocellales archaeon]MDD5446838.1 class I SAM-dependent methyltransferase family protein [Methanocellales archaeon]
MRSSCVKVPKSNGETFRKKLIEIGAMDTSLKIKSDDLFLYIPIFDGSLAPAVADVTIEQFDAVKKPKSIEEIIGFSPSYEIIGDIAILPEGSIDVGTALLKVHKNVKTVLVALSPVEGEFRVRRYRILAGENRTETVYREYGCMYTLDLQRMYFSPRLATERARVAALVKPKETVIDMFAGVGPFSILIAKRAEHVVSIDKNPDAILFLRKNVALNSISNIQVIRDDVHEVSSHLKSQGDRIIMNLPHNAREYLDDAMVMAKTMATVHYYDIQPENSFEEALETIREAATRNGRDINVLGIKKVRSYAPKSYNICVDFQVM